MVDLFRTLAALAEPPAAWTPRLAHLIGMEAPAPSAYTDLFVFQQPPYASAYLNADGMVGGGARDRVAGFWRALGFEPPLEPDHLASMLGGYATLCEYGAAQPAGPRRDALSHARCVFLREHLLPWLPPYLQAVPRHSGEPYAVWAAVLLDVLLEEADEVGPPSWPTPDACAAPPVADPRERGVDEFLAAIVAPARSGLILTRADLARAARTLDLGLRAGNRRLALRTLLEQDAPATLGWLTAEARSWEVLHQALATTIGPLAGAWAARAAATAALTSALSGDVREEQSA